MVHHHLYWFTSVDQQPETDVRISYRLSVAASAALPYLAQQTTEVDRYALCCSERITQMCFSGGVLAG